jgi:trans-2,3-dihydro-3-hydroxyanthranilate isomerase
MIAPPGAHRARGVGADPEGRPAGVIQLDFMLVDVFTDSPFGGSRLALFPDGRGLSPRLMQALAGEMGGGETAFVLPSRQRRRNWAALRIFTPTGELPFAGHSILGATCALDQLGRLAHSGEQSLCEWELESGYYPVILREDGGRTLYSLIHNPPVFLGPYYHRDKVARALGLGEREIAITGLPCEVISTGLPIHVVPIGSLAAVRQAALLRQEADAIATDLGFGDLFVFTMETESPDADVHCRMFAPHFGIPEDPASGAANGALAAYLIRHRLVPLQPHVRLVSEQGVEMGRPSRLYIEVEVDAGQASLIKVGGHCAVLGEGRLSLARDPFAA